MREELKETGLAYIWQNQHENNTNELGPVTKEKSNDTVGQNVFSMMGDTSGGRWDTPNMLQLEEMSLSG